jgi:hypothetical protein
MEDAYISDGSSTTDEQNETENESFDYGIGEETETQHQQKSSTRKITFQKYFKSIAKSFNKCQLRCRLAYCLIEVADTEGNSFAELLSKFKNQPDYLLSRATKTGFGKILVELSSMIENQDLQFESRFADTHDWWSLLELSSELINVKCVCETFNSMGLQSQNIVNPDFISKLEVFFKV